MRVRPLRAEDQPQVRRLFRSTLVLGTGPAFAIPGLRRYEALCLDWYLGPGAADAAVLEDDDATVVGYALVCTNLAAYRAWTRKQAIRFTAGLLPCLVLPSYRGPVGQFYRLRLRDGWQLARATVPESAPAHAHINLSPSHRAAWGGRLLSAHVDARVGAAGYSGWFGEINAVVGQRTRALERLGGELVGRVPNHTLSSLMNQPVERLTVRRMIPHSSLPLDEPSRDPRRLHSGL
jgi:hypothetical protein